MGDLLVAPLVFLAARLMLVLVLSIPQGIGLAGAAVCVVSGVVFAMVKAGVYCFAQVLP